MAQRKASSHVGYAVLTFVSGLLAVWAWWNFATAPYPWAPGGYGVTGLLGLAMLAAALVFYKGTTDLSLGVAGWGGAMMGIGALGLCMASVANLDGTGDYGMAMGIRHGSLVCVALGLLPAPAAGMGADRTTQAALWLAFVAAVGFLLAASGNWLSGPYHYWTVVGDAVGAFAYAGFAALLSLLLLGDRLSWPKYGPFAYLE